MFRANWPQHLCNLIIELKISRLVLQVVSQVHLELKYTRILLILLKIRIYLIRREQERRVKLYLKEMGYSIFARISRQRLDVSAISLSLVTMSLVDRPRLALYCSFVVNGTRCGRKREGKIKR